MNRTKILLGTAVVILAAVSSGAEARKVYYEINGKRYSYSTNNRAETVQAKKRIAAAKAADAAKAKADAEKSKYPLVAVFTSMTQREAKEAQEKLKQLLNERAASIEPQEKSTDRRTVVRDKQEQDRKAPRAPEPMTVIVPQQTAAIPQATPPVSPALLVPPPPVAEPISASHPTKVRSISFDVETGIKTTIMVDGMIEEEPFDSSVLSHLAPDQGQANSLVAFVNKLRKATETTGSIRTGDAQPSP
ncbi:hypothetical protein MHY87_07260 [Microvirga sp. ACRRW]|nr:hypothetical protein [Microvirga sp. ACRRW]